MATNRGVAHAAARLVRAAYVLSVIVFAAGLVTVSISLFSPFSLSRETRTWLVLLFSVPAVLFTIAHYLYECRIYSPQLPVLPKVFAFNVVLTLLLPPAFLIFRLSWPEWFRTIVQVASMIGIPLIILRMSILIEPVTPETENIFRAAVKYMRCVMWDVWTNEEMRKPALIYRSEMTANQIRAARARFYFEKTALQMFQSSLTCQERDSVACGDLLRGAFKTRSLSVLDIGGCEGAFTANVLSALQREGKHFTEIVMIDPCDWHSEYVATLRSVVDDSKISVTRTTLENFDVTEKQFDLVIASHSLYSLFDLSESAQGGSKAKFQKLRNLIKREGGIGLVILASPRARSYQFKATVMRDIFGRSVQDASAEILSEHLEGLRVQDHCVDNVIDLTDAFAQYDAGRPNLLSRWLSYFLRVDIDSLHSGDFEGIVECLRLYTVTVDSLSEREIEAYEACVSLKLTRHSRVLAHKSVIYLVST